MILLEVILAAVAFALLAVLGVTTLSIIFAASAIVISLVEKAYDRVSRKIDDL